MTRALLLHITERTTLVSCLFAVQTGISRKPVKYNMWFTFVLCQAIHILQEIFQTVSCAEFFIDSVYIHALYYVYLFGYLYSYTSSRLEVYHGLVRAFGYELLVQCLAYSIFYWKRVYQINGPIFSFQKFQMDFLSHHQNVDNQFVHIITIFCTLVSMFGVLHHQVCKIKDIGIQIPIIFGTYYCIKYSVDIHEPFENMLYIRFFTTGFMACILGGFVWLDRICNMNGGRYMMIFILSILLQEVSHIAYSESALMYDYNEENGDILLQFPLHGYFLVPLISQFFLVRL